MARFIDSALASLDGYVADRDGNFDWAAPDEEVHTAVNDLSRPDRHVPVGTTDVRGSGGLGDDGHRR